MTRETRIAMLVGLLFIVMFGLVISGLTGGANSSASLRAGGQSIAPRYIPVLQIDPPPPGESPGEALARNEPSGTSLELARGTPDACSVVEVEWPKVRRTEGAAPEPDGSRPAGPPTRSVALIDPPPQPPPPAPPSPPAKRHVVKVRETLIKIAREEYGPENEMQFALIQQANKDVLHGGTRLVVGQELVIPPLPAATPPRPPGGAAPAPAYTVMGLEDLRRTFGPSPAPSGPTPAPGPAASRPPESAKQYHVVRRGETLAQIAREKMRDGSLACVRRLYNANKDKIRDPDSLPIGVRLEIPA